MFNRDYKTGKNVRAARRLAGILMAGTLAGTLAVGNAPAVFVSAATWQENANYIFDYLTQRLHYSEAAACGIMANIRCESTFNPHAWNAGGGSYGLCQWTGGRYGRLQSWCRSNGYDYSTIDGQLAYLEYELQNHYTGVENYLRSVENTRDGAYNAGQYYCYHFEAPASRGSVSVYRGGLASGTFWDSYRPAEWYQVEGIWRYVLRDGSYQTGWLTLEDDTFYFDEEGRRICGWKTIDGKRYYFDDEGVMTTGWMKVDGRNYYFGEDGAMVTGIMRDGEELYLVDEYGTVQGSSDMKKYAPVWIAMKEEEQEQQALASAEDLSQEASATDSTASAASGEKTLAANTAGENEPEKTEESGQPEEIKDQSSESDYVKEALASVDFGKDALQSAAAENIAAEDAFAAPEEVRETQDREAGEDQVIEESEDRNIGRDQFVEATEEPETVLASAGQGSETFSRGQEQHKGLGIHIPGFSTPVQEQGVSRDIEGIEEKEDYSSAAEAMLAAAEGLNEEGGEEAEASAFVPDSNVVEEEVSEAAEAAGETETAIAELTDQGTEEEVSEAEKAAGETGTAIAELTDQGTEEEVSEAAEAAGETETTIAELTDQGGTTVTSITETGITAPLADPGRSDESDKTDSTQRTAQPFGFSGLIARLTGGADSKKNNPYAPVYSLPFSYTDARILGKQTDDGEYDAEEESAGSVAEADILEMPFDGGTSEITLAAATDDSEDAGRKDDSLKDNPSENSKTGLSDDDEEDKSHQSENMEDFRADDEDTDGEDKNSTDGTINVENSGKAGTEEKTVEDDSEDQEKPGDKDDSEDQEKPEDKDDSEDQEKSEDKDDSKDQEKSEDKDDSEDQEKSEDKDDSEDQEKSEDKDDSEDQEKSEDKDDFDDRSDNQDKDEDKSEEAKSAEEDKDEDESEEAKSADEAKDEDESEEAKSADEDKEENKSDEDEDGETGKDKSDDLETDEDRDEEDEDDEDSDDSDSEEGEIRLTLNGDIPDISYEDKDDLVDILRRKNILHAVSGNGLNITPQVEASFEREDGDNYTVTFRVEYNGSEAELESSVRITD